MASFVNCAKDGLLTVCMVTATHSAFVKFLSGFRWFRATQKADLETGFLFDSFLNCSISSSSFLNDIAWTPTNHSLRNPGLSLGSPIQSYSQKRDFGRATSSISSSSLAGVEYINWLLKYVFKSVNINSIECLVSPIHTDYHHFWCQSHVWASMVVTF